MEKLKTFCAKYFKNHIVTIFIVSILLVVLIETMARHSLIQSISFMVSSPLVFACNTAIVFALLSISMLFRRRFFATCMLSLVWIVLGTVNGIILSNRMTPFTVKDFANFKDGLSILENYFSVKTVSLAIVVLAVVVFLIVVLFRKLPKLDRKVHFKRTIASILVVFMGTLGIISMGMKVGVLDTFFGNLAYGYRDNGVVYSFMVTWVKTGIDRPENYSSHNIKAIFENNELGYDGIYTPGEDDNTNVKNKPNILFLQLESFIDPTLVEGLEYSKDPVPNFRKLTKEYSSGYLTVPSVGAGTANVEFEVMTGLSAKFFGPGEYPYKSILKEETVEATPYQLKELGYSAHAIHNHRGAFYFRNKVFANMGFDTFTALEYMNNVMKTPKNWAKDGILTEQIVTAMNSTKSKDYIYTISVQGHGKYPAEEVLENPEITVTKAQDEEQKWKYEYYVNQIYEMDLFIKELTDTLAAFDEDVVLVMYGDHLPALDMTEESMKTGELYDTQYIVWDNFGMEKQDMDIATYSLTAEVLDRLDISVGMMTKYHQNYRGSQDYMTDLKALGYDMLYGKKFIYGEKNPYKTTDLQMGMKKIKVNEVVQIGEDFYIKGENFTEYSKISLDGEILETVYLGPSILALKEEVDPEAAVNMKVSQVEKNKEVLSTTE
jgi:phosphoglycerol transferase MdoB-like AlkP superfamily enzyme